MKDNNSGVEPYFSLDKPNGDPEKSTYLLWEPVSPSETLRISEEIKAARDWGFKLVVLLGAVLVIMPLCFLVSTGLGLFFTLIAIVGAVLVWMDNGFSPPMVSSKSMKVDGRDILELKTIAQYDPSLLGEAHSKTWQMVKLAAAARSDGDEKIAEALSMVRADLEALVSRAFANRERPGDRDEAAVREGRNVADEVL